MLWFPACFALAFHLDGGQTTWRAQIVITALFLMNLLFYVLAWKLGNVVGIITTVPFLWFGFRLAAVIDARSLSQPRWTPTRTNIGPTHPSALDAARTDRRAYKRPRPYCR